jgi:hypothetical protein
VSPRGTTGWSAVDTEIAALRQRFKTASEPQDYRDVGNRAVAVLEVISATVYDHAVHGLPGSEEPPVSKTDIRIGAYIDSALPGGPNEQLRGLVKRASAVAHKVKHSTTGSRRDAGMIGDTVILLANLLRETRHELSKPTAAAKASRINYRTARRIVEGAAEHRQRQLVAVG